MSAKKKMNVPEDRLRLYEQLIDAVAGVEAKSNFGSGYTAVNGNMYSMISKHGVVGIRLPEPERSAFSDRYEAELFRGDPACRRPRNTSRFRASCSRTPTRSGPTCSAASSTP